MKYDKVLKDLSSIKTVVIELLEKHPHLRDDDKKLTANIWNREMRMIGIDANTASAFQLLSLYAEGRLTLADTITRARRKVQEDVPELRGKLWNERHEAELDVRQNIKYI